MIEIKHLLTLEEQKIVHPYYEEMGVKFEEQPLILAAFADDKLLSFLTFNFIPHAGLTYTLPEYRQKGIAQLLLDYLCKEYNGQFFSFPSNEFAVKGNLNAGLVERTDLRIFERKAKNG